MRREDSRRVPLRRVGLLFGGAALLTLAIVAAILLTSRNAEAEPIDTAAIPAERDRLLRGIPQDGLVLGSPKAPVTVVEFADLQCPYCARFAGDPFRTVVEDYVRTGRVRLVFRGLAFLGPDSDKALRAALAAGKQDRLWDVVHALYEQQEGENTGWVTDELLQGLALPGLDVQRMIAGSDSAGVSAQVEAASTAAEQAGLTGTPFFLGGPTGGKLAALRPASLDTAAFQDELDRLLAG